jgi:hypothetical protein
MDALTAANIDTVVATAGESAQGAGGSEESERKVDDDVTAVTAGTVGTRV